MSVYKNGEETYKGQVLGHDYHTWMDGMEDEYAIVWDMDSHSIKRIQVGYRGIDGRNLMKSHAVVDVTEDVKKDILRTLKKSAMFAFAKSVTTFKKTIRKGSKVKVVRGRKIPKGTVIDVFWVGERPTYRAMVNTWMDETESYVGGYDSNGNKVWIKADYCEVIDKLKSPNRKERDKFIKQYIEEKRTEYGI